MNTLKQLCDDLSVLHLPDASTIEIEMTDDQPCPKIESIESLKPMDEHEKTLLSVSASMGKLMKEVQVGNSQIL